MMAQFPSKEIAQRSYDFRTLGLGYANIGGLLMNMGLGYDSDEGRALCGALTAIMTGISYATSAEMAGELGAFPGYAKNARPHAAGDPQPPQRGLWQDRRLRGPRGQAGGARPRELSRPSALFPLRNPPGTRRCAWARSTATATPRSTVIAPTGTIGLVMDCDTTGIEPDFALVKFKKLAGGGYFKIINRSVPAALETLGYGSAEIEEIIAYAVGHGSLGNCPGINHTSLIGHGFGQAELEKIEAALPSAFDIRFVFNQWTLGEKFCRETLGIPVRKARTIRPSTCCATSASPASRSRPPTTMSAAP